MIIERTNNEVIIRLSSNIDTEDLQKILNFARYKELTANFKLTQVDAEDLISEVKQAWSKNEPLK